MTSELIDYGHFKVAVIPDYNILITTLLKYDEDEIYHLDFSFVAPNGLKQNISFGYKQEDEMYDAFEKVTIKQAQGVIAYSKNNFSELFGYDEEWDED